MFGLVGFYGTSTIVGYLMPNPLFTYILDINVWFGWVLWHIKTKSFFTYILDINVWFGWVLWHINHCWLFNAKSSFYIYIRYKCLVWLGFMAHQPLLVI